MTDWKEKVDQFLNKQELSKADQKILDEQKKAQEDKEKINAFRKRFVCHVCSRPSIGPVTGNSNDGVGWQERSAIDTTYTLWDSPKDLTKCTKCKKWACAEHIHKGVCKECAEKM